MTYKDESNQWLKGLGFTFKSEDKRNDGSLVLHYTNKKNTNIFLSVIEFANGKRKARIEYNEGADSIKTIFPYKSKDTSLILKEVQRLADKLKSLRLKRNLS